MGASGWLHFVPYNPDVGRALLRLRQEVFAQGAYHAPRKATKAASIQALLRQCGEEGTHSVLDVDRVVEAPLPLPVLTWHQEVLKATGAPPSPEALRKRMLDEAKHYGVVAPLAEAQQLALFGTARPERAAVERSAFAISPFVPRGCGVYVVVYDASGAPAEIFFTGKTGD